MAAEKIGAETVTYVSNIYKYYIAYRLIVDDMARKQKATAVPRQEPVAAASQTATQRGDSRHRSGARHLNRSLPWVKFHP